MRIQAAGGAGSEGPLVAVVADDLTSAVDGAAPFARRGLRVSVVRDDRTTVDAEVVALDTATRRCREAEARQRTAVAVRAVLGATIVLKTIDSTLRGHVGVETRAAIDAAGRPLVIIAPAFPGAGRTTSSGVQHAHGVPVSDSVYGHDGLHRAGTSVIAELLAGPGDGPVTLVRTGDDVPVTGVVVADATTDEHLDALVHSAGDLSRVLWVGSPGLAQALARRVSGQPARKQAITARRLLVLVGTRHPATRAQVTRLLAALGSRAAVLDTADPRDDVDVGVLLAPRPTGDPSMPLERIAADVVADALAARAADLLRSGRYDACAASGGETAEALLRALDVQRLDLLDEPEPGIGLALVGDRHGGWPLIAKAGGFGDPDTLVRLHATLTRRTDAC